MYYVNHLCSSMMDKPSYDREDLRFKIPVEESRHVGETYGKHYIVVGTQASSKSSTLTTASRRPSSKT